MSSSLFLIAFAASLTGPAPGPGPSLQSKNGEFIFSQYPPRAKAAGEQGAVRFRADVDASGNVMSCKVTASSGYERLDNETCEMIVDHATFKPTLDDKGKARAAVHDGIVNWRIPGDPAPVASQNVASADSHQKIICKRIPKTGSLITHSRLCLTARDWDRYAESFQDDWGSLQGRKGHTNAAMPTWTVGQ